MVTDLARLLKQQRLWTSAHVRNRSPPDSHVCLGVISPTLPPLWYCSVNGGQLSKLSLLRQEVQLDYITKLSSLSALQLNGWIYHYPLLLQYPPVWLEGYAPPETQGSLVCNHRHRLRQHPPGELVDYLPTPPPPESTSSTRGSLTNNGSSTPTHLTARI